MAGKGGMSRDDEENSPLRGDSNIPTAVPFDANMTIFTANDYPDLPSEYQILGSDFSQLLEIQVQPGQTISAEPGTMVHFKDGIQAGADFGTCSQACTRCCCAGENFFRLNFKNNKSEPLAIGLTPINPAKVIPINLGKYSGFTVKGGAFVAASHTNWRFKLKFVRNIAAGCFGGMGFFLTEIHGDEGWVFIGGSGTVVTKQLQPGEILHCDNESVVAFQSGLKYSVSLASNSCLGLCCGGMGLFNVKLDGGANGGWVMLETMPMERLRKALNIHSIQSGGNNGSQGADAAAAAN